MTAEKSSFLFALIGLGSLCGAVASGVFARLIGTSASLLANYLLGASAVAIVLLTDDLSWISLSAFILGFFLLACVALSSQRTGEVVGTPRHAHHWGLLTLGFALGVAIGSYGLSGLVDFGWPYYSTFAIAGGALTISVLLSLGLIALANEPERI